MLLDASGGRWKEPPRKRESDDAFKVQAAREEWALLSRSLRHVLLAQSERLEELMLQGWRWGREQFRRNVQHHPLMCHFARNLLWASYDGEGRPSHPFRVAEDLTLANVHDDEIELPGNGPIGIVHRRELDPATVSKWSSIFADYQIRTPFEQLQRELNVPEEGELALEEIARLRHVAIEPKAFRTYVKHHGFKRGAPDYYRVRTAYYRDFPWIGQRAVWNISPGLEAGRYEDDRPQTIHSITFHAIDRFDSHNEYSPSLTIEDVHPIVFSEALRHARRLIEGAQE